MFSNIGIPGLILIFVIALIIFGPSKLPEIGTSRRSDSAGIQKRHKITCVW